MPNLPPPVMVSPVIKFFRYSFLITGVMYGYLKQQVFSAWEAGRVDIKARRRAERDARLIEERRLAAVADFNQIVEIFSPPAKVESAFDVVTDQGYDGAVQGMSNVICDSTYEAIQENDNQPDYNRVIDADIAKSGDAPKTDGPSQPDNSDTTSLLDFDMSKPDDSEQLYGSHTVPEIKTDIPENDDCTPTSKFYDQPIDISLDDFTGSNAAKGAGDTESRNSDGNGRCDVELPDKSDDSGYIIKDFGNIPVLPPDEDGRFPREK